jgi:hypothetical protein
MSLSLFIATTAILNGGRGSWTQFGNETPKDLPSHVLLKLVHLFQRRRFTTDDGYQVMTKAHKAFGQVR